MVGRKKIIKVQKTKKMENSNPIYSIIVLCFSFMAFGKAQSNESIYGVYVSNEYHGVSISITDDDSLKFSLSGGLLFCSFKSKCFINANEIKIERPQLKTEVVINSCITECFQDSVLVRVLERNDSMPLSMAGVLLNNKYPFLCNEEGETLVPKSIKIKSAKIIFLGWDIPTIYLQDNKTDCFEVTVHYRGFCEKIYIKKLKYKPKKQKLLLVYYNGEYKKTTKLSLNKLRSVE